MPGCHHFKCTWGGSFAAITPQLQRIHCSSGPRRGSRTRDGRPLLVLLEIHFGCFFIADLIIGFMVMTNTEKAQTRGLTPTEDVKNSKADDVTVPVLPVRVAVNGIARDMAGIVKNIKATGRRTNQLAVRVAVLPPGQCRCSPVTQVRGDYCGP